VWSVAGYALLIAVMHILGIQDFTGMTPQAIIVDGLDARMRFMTLVAIKPGHGYLFRK
jgi:hypothetical protein